jgi:8-oxo-dGTP pyrophosphatase MutT (NUDIX family)
MSDQILKPDNISPDLVAFADRLRERLAQPLPGPAIQRRFAPELAYGRHFGPPAVGASPAAVVALFYLTADGWQLPLIVRPKSMPHHAGQVSFPGGRVERDESSADAALRELHEELGVRSARVELLGRLSPIYLFNSNFAVTAWVAVVRNEPAFVPSPEEVAELIALPLAHLLQPTNYGSHTIRSRGVTIRTPHLLIGQQRIWGATLMLLGELAAICHDCVHEISHH